MLEWDPPGRLTLAWHIGPHRERQPDPESASTIEVRFRAEVIRAARYLR